jgi:hypothetical protein
MCKAVAEGEQQTVCCIISTTPASVQATNVAHVPWVATAAHHSVFTAPHSPPQTQLQRCLALPCHSLSFKPPTDQDLLCLEPDGQL